jgi:hypothetical protein
MKKLKRQESIPGQLTLSDLLPKEILYPSIWNSQPKGAETHCVCGKEETQSVQSQAKSTLNP